MCVCVRVCVHVCVCVCACVHVCVHVKGGQFNFIVSMDTGLHMCGFRPVSVR